ncbi:MAG: hypothetical protein WD604_06530 [Balneolaceae bacterium]
MNMNLGSYVDESRLYALKMADEGCQIHILNINFDPDTITVRL